MKPYKKRFSLLAAFCFTTMIVFSSVLIQAQTVPIFDSLQLVYTDTIYFESARWDLDSLALNALKHFPNPKSEKDRIYLTGHTDAVGSLEYNENLAHKRAQTAKDILMKNNWNESSMVIQTFGERKAIRSNDNEENRQLNRRVQVDLYRPVPFLTMKGRVVDPTTEEGVKAQLRIHSRSMSDSLNTNENGVFELVLPVDSIVGIDVFAEGYFFKTQMMKVKLSANPLLKIELQKASVGAAADLSKLYFVGNKAVLLERSESELPKIKRFLQINNQLRVEIAGHVNYPNKPPVTKDTFEWTLSEKRAQFLYDWLINEGIPADQISHKGYGNHEMKYPNARTEKQQELNRRVEIRILGERGE